MSGGFGGLGGHAGGGGGGTSLSESQLAALDSMTLPTISDFSGDLPANFRTLPIPSVQASGTYVCTTYDFTASGLQVTVSHDDTMPDGTNVAVSPGFVIDAPNTDIDFAIDIDNFTDIPDSVGANWVVDLLMCEGGTSRKDALFGIRYEVDYDGGSAQYRVRRCVSPSYAQGWYSMDEDILGSAPSSIRLRLRYSVKDAGYKVLYSTDGGSNYTTLEGSNWGTGWIQLHTRDGNPNGQHDRYRMGTRRSLVVLVGQSVSKVTAQGEQGSARIQTVAL